MNEANSTNDGRQLAFAAGIPLASLQANEHFVIPYIFVSLSAIVNLVLVNVVLCSRQLHEPRHIYWAGISLIVLFYTADWLIKAFISSDTNYIACAIYKLTICVSYPSLLTFLCLAGFDRYLAIKHYEWYKRKMNNRKAMLSMLVALVINWIAFDLPYFVGSLIIGNCLYDVTHALCFVAWSVILGIANVVLQVKVFIISKRVIHFYLSDHVSKRRHIKQLFIDNRIDLSAESFPKKVTDRLDFRAALIFSANVLPFLLCTIPLGLNSLAMCACILWKLNCSTNLLVAADAYLKYTVFTPCILMPLMYMWTSREFQRAFLHLFWKIESRANSVNRSVNRRSVNYLN